MTLYPGEIAERSAQEHFEDNTTMSAAITLRESHSQSAKPSPSIAIAMTSYHDHYPIAFLAEMSITAMTVVC